MRGLLVKSEEGGDQAACATLEGARTRLSMLKAPAPNAAIAQSARDRRS
jgi:hypothetical protein